MLISRVVPSIVMGRAAAIGLTVAMVAGCTDDPGRVRTEAADVAGETASTSADATPATELTDEEIRARAVAAAEDLGDADPTDIEWVRSSRREAAKVMSGSDVGGDEDDDAPVIVIQARGSFTVQGEGGVPDEAGNTAPPPTGTAFTLLLDAATGDFRGLGVTPEAVPLDDLGEVHRL